MGEGSVKETSLKVLLAIFVIFLISAFVYFLLLSPRGRIEARTVKVYFLKGEELTRIVRTIKSDAPSERLAIETLLAGPTEKEEAAGIFSEIPRGTKVIRVFIEGDTAFADFNRTLGEYGGGSAMVQGIVSQIVYTLTEIPGVKKVGILVEGKSQVVLGGEGYVLEKPLSRDDARP